jgi:hypothetical protein
MYWARVTWAFTRAIFLPAGWQKPVRWLVVLGIFGAAFQPELRGAIDDVVSTHFGFTPTTWHYLLAAAIVLIVGLALQVARLTTPRIRIANINVVPSSDYQTVQLVFRNESGLNLNDVMGQFEIFTGGIRCTAHGRDSFVMISSQELADRIRNPQSSTTRHRYSIDAFGTKSFNLLKIHDDERVEFCDEIESIWFARADNWQIDCKISHGQNCRFFVVPGDGTLDSDYCVFTYLRPWHFRYHRVFVPCRGLRLRIHAHLL